MNLQPIIEKAKVWAEQEGNTYGPPLELSALANAHGQQLAQALGADKEIVLLGTLLMDIKLGESMKQGKAAEHVKICLAAAKDFLDPFDLDEETRSKILNCVEAHHNDVPFLCPEAEICANADCYKFLHPKGIFIYFSLLGTRSQDYKFILDQVEKKMDEKWDILSLDVCKAELRPYYEQFKAHIAQAREEKI